jgi:LmbE family N-acetylglucosaminyl deacetylase
VTNVEWDELQRALVVIAHPDDAEFGCAGTVAKLAGDGKEVFYALVTDGSKGSSDETMTPDALIHLRQSEQKAAAAVLGVKHVEFLGFPDGMLEPSLEVRKAVSAAIRRYKPDLVICQSPIRDLTMGVFVQHPDHLAAGEATFAAVYPCARDRMTFPDLLAAGLEPHAVHELWVSGTPAPDHFIDISNTIDRKVEALLAHASQVGDRVREMIPQRAKAIGEPHEMEYAEGFRRIQIP